MPSLPGDEGHVILPLKRKNKQTNKQTKKKQVDSKKTIAFGGS